MIQLTINNQDGTKQVLNMDAAILKDNKNKELHIDKIKDKVKSIAQSISGTNYKSHKLVIS